MRDLILLVVALGAVLAAAARAEVPSPQDTGTAPPPPQIVVVPVPESSAPDGGVPAVVITDVPMASADGGTPGAVAGGPGEPDAGPSEEIILIVPRRPPPPPEPPRQIKVTVMHTPRPRVEIGQAALELGASTGVFMIGSAVLFAGELIPIIIADSLFNAPGVASAMLHGFGFVNAALLPLASTIAIERVKAYSRHYQLEGLGWWATYGAGVLIQAIAAGITFATPDVGEYISSPHPWIFGVLTPVSQTVVANVLATPRDPLAPFEGVSRYQPRLLDGNGRPIPIVHVLSISF